MVSGQALAGTWDCKGPLIGGVWAKSTAGNSAPELAYLPLEWWLTVGGPLVSAGAADMVVEVVVVDIVAGAKHTNQIMHYSACSPAHGPARGFEPGVGGGAWSWAMGKFYSLDCSYLPGH